MKKVWMVHVELSTSIPVVAETAEEAEAIASEFADDDYRDNGYSWNTFFSAGKPLEKCADVDILEALPYGNQDDGEELTVGELLEKQQEALEAEAIKAFIEANQMKLPLEEASEAKEDK